MRPTSSTRGLRDSNTRSCIGLLRPAIDSPSHASNPPILLLQLISPRASPQLEHLALTLSPRIQTASSGHARHLLDGVGPCFGLISSPYALAFLDAEISHTKLLTAPPIYPSMAPSTTKRQPAFSCIARRGKSRGQWASTRWSEPQLPSHRLLINLMDGLGSVELSQASHPPPTRAWPIFDNRLRCLPFQSSPSKHPQRLPRAMASPLPCR